jgi:hypothetical protein
MESIEMTGTAWLLLAIVGLVLVWALLGMIGDD